uniref:Long chain N-acylphenylalanine synthase n=1 Tax=uncultured bacterium CSL142 TaxID=1091569 RepID=Q076H6_9BACT|nr:long chain N-acylphenylalanine synthase [uncultured bacterium CSL142]
MPEQVNAEVAAQKQSWASKNVKLATTEAEKEAIYRLRYEVYVEEMGGATRELGGDTTKRQARDQMDETAAHFYVSQKGQVVACLRFNLRRDCPFECETELALQRFAPAYPNHISMTSRLMLHPKLRGSHVVMELACAAFEYGIRQGVSHFDFIDCHPRLIPLYSRLGYRIYKSGFRHPKYIYVVPMVMVGGDLEYLQKIKSPFAAIAASLPATTQYRDMLLAQFPDASQGQPTSDLEQSAFWQLARTRLLDPTATIEHVSLFSHLTEEQIKFLTSFGHVVRCKSGDPVLLEGDPGREIFVILEGSFRIRASEDKGSGWMYKPLTPGDIFGEIAFLTNGLRAASVVAMEDATLLILQGRALTQLAAVQPKLAAVIFRNVASIVATRMRDSLQF